VYYVVSEALVNVAKHANASGARVSISELDGQVVVEVSDDGLGGADAEGGSGLRGLADRVEALDGRLEVDSRATGTTLRASIPLR
jgi:signal transduction histidine kinase